VLKWISILNAIAQVEATLGLARSRAEAVLMEACLQEEVGARYNPRSRASDWVVRRSFVLDPDAIYLAVKDDREHIDVNADDLRRWLMPADGLPPLTIAPASTQIAATHKRPSSAAAMKSAQDYFDHEIKAKRTPTLKGLDAWVQEKKLPYRDHIRRHLRNILNKNGTPVQRGRRRKLNT
jgi:hypothetical protein